MARPESTAIPKFLAALSTSSIGTPSLTSRIDSVRYLARIRLTKNPGQSLTTKGSLPMALAKLIARLIVSWDVKSATPISTNFIAFRGLKKCIAIHLSLDTDFSAISERVREDVLVANTDFV